MLQFEEYRQRLKQMRPDIEEIGAALDLEAVDREIAKLEEQTGL